MKNAIQKTEAEILSTGTLDEVNKVAAAMAARATDAERADARTIVFGSTPGTPQTNRNTLISPMSVAIILTEHNGFNRPFSLPESRRIAAAINRGEWKNTHQGAAFTTEGHTMDSQHRFYAILISGVTVFMMTNTNESKENMEAIDIGSKRTVADALGIRSIGEPKAKANMAARGSAYSSILAGRKPSRLSIPQAEAYVATHNDLMDVAIEIVDFAGGKTPPLTPADAQAITFNLLINAADSATIKQFMYNLQNGIDRVDGLDSAAIETARVLIIAKNTNATSKKLNGVKRNALVIKGYNAWVSGNVPKQLRLSKRDATKLPTRNVRAVGTTVNTTSAATA